MKLLIVSHTEHYLRDGQIVGWGPTVREIDHLAALFDEVVHIAPLHPNSAPVSALPYRSGRVRLRHVPPAGGRRLVDKLGILSRIPSYAGALKEELKTADVIHVRCPANISLLAIVLLIFVKAPRLRWFKYAGNWGLQGRQPASYKLQRWLLSKRFHRGVVTVNGRWPGQPEHVHSFSNPCLSNEELEQARTAAKSKRLTLPLQILYVGSLKSAKGVDRVLEIASRLKQQGIEFKLNLAGDGPDRARLEALSVRLGLEPYVFFHGWLPQTSIGPLYAKSHLLLLPSDSEGWPKVLSEGMAYGVVPIASAVSGIAQVLSETGAGVALPPTDVDGFTQAVVAFEKDHEKWESASRAGTSSAQRFTYEHYLKALDCMSRGTWGVALIPAKSGPALTSATG